MPGPGAEVEGVKEVNKPSKPPKMYENDPFPKFNDLKIVENAFFSLKST
jgi:hypothetical protein